MARRPASVCALVSSGGATCRRPNTITIYEAKASGDVASMRATGGRTRALRRCGSIRKITVYAPNDCEVGVDGTVLAE